MKINKLMVHRRLCSRREANDYIKRGLVLVCLQYVQNLIHLTRKHSLSHTKMHI
jgi:16S rRNA U516 pseudouridylate synthase RsuA-like enzyme